MKQGEASSTTSPPQRQTTSHALNECAVADIGLAKSSWYREPLSKGIIPEPGGPPNTTLPDGSQKG